MYRFQATVHFQSGTVSVGETVQLGTVRLLTLAVNPRDTAQTFAVSFEQAAERMQGLGRMCVEPDGSFVWAGSNGNWQLDGSLIDDGRHVRHVELAGTCVSSALDALLRILDWPASPVMFQLTRYGVYLPEVEFRRYASQPSE